MDTHSLHTSVICAHVAPSAPFHCRSPPTGTPPCSSAQLQPSLPDGIHRNLSLLFFLSLSPSPLVGCLRHILLYVRRRKQGSKWSHPIYLKSTLPSTFKYVISFWQELSLYCPCLASLTRPETSGGRKECTVMSLECLAWPFMGILHYINRFDSLIRKLQQRANGSASSAPP